MRNATNTPADGTAAVDQAQAFWAGFGEIQRELFRFAMDRLEKDAELVRSAMGNRNLAEVVALQSRWLSETVEDYSAEASKVTKILTAHAPEQGKGPARK